MGIFKKRKRSQQARDKPEAFDQQVQSFADTRSVSRSRADLYMQNHEAVFAAVSRIATTLASMPLHLYKGHDIQWGDKLDKLVEVWAEELGFKTNEKVISKIKIGA